MPANSPISEPLNLQYPLESVHCLPVIDSKAGLTREYRLKFACGSVGTGSAPRGETLSCYERHEPEAQPESVERILVEDGVIGSALTLREFDDYLFAQTSRLGTATVFSLSCAFFEAIVDSAGYPPVADDYAPRFCLNILNGGRHAYTNPVLSDFHEFLLVHKQGGLGTLLEDHRAIQASVGERLSRQATMLVNGRAVHVLSGRGNAGCIEFLLGILDDLGLAGRYGLMIDAAAGCLWTGEAYDLALAERRQFSPRELAEYWQSLLERYPVAVLEDPFAEHDLDHWRDFAALASPCRVTGDDVHCGDPGRLRKLLDSGCLAGVVLKPDQSGTVSRAIDAIDAARAANVPVILSHRSIGTDSLLLAHLMLQRGVEYAKFGPLLTAFTSVLCMNEVLRMSHAHGSR